MKILRVGDPHAKVSNLVELEKLMEFVLNIVQTQNIDRLEILGDLFHTHAVLRLEVLEFWDYWLDNLSEHVETFVLVGNHDQTGDHTLETHALSVFKRIKRNNLHIIGNPQPHGVYAYMPYYHDAAKFIEIANGMAAQGANVLVSHQTYSGSQFENGFYAPDGIDPDLLDYDLIISGHIHARQTFVTKRGQVIYPGTARWDGLSDANQPKGLWLAEHDEAGKIRYDEYINTESVCEPIRSFTWTEGEEMPRIPDKGRNTVELIGSSNWVSQRKADLKGKVALKSKITDKDKVEVRRTGLNLQDFVENLFTTTTDRALLIKWMKEQELV